MIFDLPYILVHGTQHGEADYCITVLDALGKPLSRVLWFDTDTMKCVQNLDGKLTVTTAGDFGFYPPAGQEGVDRTWRDLPPELHAKVHLQGTYQPVDPS